MRIFSVLAAVWISFSVFGQRPVEVDSTMIKVWATYYYVPTVNHLDTGIELLNIDEKPLGFRLDSCSWCQAAIEGTVLIRKQEKSYVLNYAGRSKALQYDCRLCIQFKNYKNYNKTGQVLWMLSDGFGKGIMNYDLIPYKTIAVDKEVIPYGSLVYIPAAKGVSYLNEKGESKIHDGYFLADDTGSLINGNHIDVFLGTSTTSPFLFIKSSPDGVFDAYLIQNQVRVDKIRSKNQLH